MNISFLLKQTNKKKKNLANYANITTNTIRNYESGTSEPTLSTLLKIAEFFNVSLDTLVGKNSDIVDLKTLSSNKQKLVTDILNLDAADTDKVLAFIAGINANKK